MSKRATDEDINAGIWPVEIESSTLGDAGEVVLEVDDEVGTTTVDAETWGLAGFQSRPRDGSRVEGYAKALRIQLGESVIVVSTYDPRELVPCEKGEVCIFALGQDGASRAYVKLRPDGVVQVEGVRTEMHGSSYEVAVASKVETELGSIETELGSIQTTLASLAGQASFTTPYTNGYTVGDVSSTKVKIGG